MTETLPVLKSGPRVGSSQPVLLLRNIKNGDGRARRFPLEKFRLSIGRSPEDDICLSEGSGVSRNHASVLVLDGEVVIEDLGSRNGTYVNRKLIRGSRQTTLKFGDVIAIGRYRLKLVDEAATERADTTVSDVQSLLASWKAVKTPYADVCPLCHEPCHGTRDDAADEAQAAEPEPLAEACMAEDGEQFEAITIALPVHGRTYGRKLSRRPLLRRRPAPSKRASLAIAKRQSSIGLGAAGPRTPSAGLH